MFKKPIEAPTPSTANHCPNQNKQGNKIQTQNHQTQNILFRIGKVLLAVIDHKKSNEWFGLKYYIEQYGSWRVGSDIKAVHRIKHKRKKSNPAHLTQIELTLPK